MVCQTTNCREDGSIMVDGCGRISLPNCTLIENARLLKPYPYCCEMTYECVDANGNKSTKEWNQLDSNNSNAENGKIVPAENGQKPDYQMISPFILQLLLFV
ncbi:uncharacterized protein LOC129945818 [Eupeodes corollae]|uniref:uncharacterized protein LOC129945818 n=1 Tax=Eupeodes corollae TaxID=290404 RepID=UPI002490A4B1|nr:uncharacterized protein LOC129945818 [Eupeodes corollae]